MAPSLIIPSHHTQDPYYLDQYKSNFEDENQCLSGEKEIIRECGAEPPAESPFSKREIGNCSGES